jgi:hypothetical protein
MSSEFDNTETLDQFSKGLETKTNAQVADELSSLELEEKRLDLEIKRETVASIRAKRASQLGEARAKSLATRQFLAQRAAQQANCNHRKGGIGHEAVMRGQGTDAMYSVWKHKQPNGTWFVLCSRCGKEWHQEFRVQGRLIEAGTPGFLDAINYPSDNSPSGSAVFNYQQDYAEQGVS